MEQLPQKLQRIDVKRGLTVVELHAAAVSDRDEQCERDEERRNQRLAQRISRHQAASASSAAGARAVLVIATVCSFTIRLSVEPEWTFQAQRLFDRRYLEEPVDLLGDGVELDVAQDAAILDPPHAFEAVRSFVVTGRTERRAQRDRRSDRSSSYFAGHTEERQRFYAEPRREMAETGIVADEDLALRQPPRGLRERFANDADSLDAAKILLSASSLVSLPEAPELIQLVTRALTLATQGANATMTTQAEQSLAEEVQGITQQMVSNSNTSVQGRFIFSGDDDTTPAYTYDPASTTTNYVDQGSAAASTRQIEDPAGGSFPAALTAQQIFDDRNADGSYANDNVFQALGNLYNALLSGNSDAVGSTIANLQAANQQLNSMQSFYGEVEDRIDAGQTFANNYATQLQTEIGNVQDADIPTAVMQMTQSNIAEQAALAMEGKMPHNSLFDYLG